MDQQRTFTSSSAAHLGSLHSKLCLRSLPAAEIPVYFPQLCNLPKLSQGISESFPCRATLTHQSQPLEPDPKAAGAWGEAPLLAGHSPGQVRNPTWLPQDHPGHLEKAPGEHQPSSCLPACLVDGGRTRKQQPMEEGGCRDARIKATSCFQTPSKREHTPSPTSEHPSTRMSLPETTELVPLCRGPQKLLCPTSQSPFPSPVAAGPPRARANTTNTVSLKPLQCRCCFHGN